MATPAQQFETLIGKIKQLPLERLAETEDFVDFLLQKSKRQPVQPSQIEPLNFPVDDLGQWPEGLSLNREDMYGDDGR